MVRGIILGGLAFVAVFAAERQFESMKKDIDRYNSMRAMSGDVSLFKQALNSGLELLSSFGSSRRSDGLPCLDATGRNAVCPHLKHVSSTSFRRRRSRSM
jgi:hypothetical protein